LKQLTTELEHQRQDLGRAQAEKADAVRAAGVAEGVRARAEERIDELDISLKQCQEVRERLGSENRSLVEQVRTLPPPTAEGPSLPRWPTR
jgi:chromosome segregation ATPase